MSVQEVRHGKVPRKALMLKLVLNMGLEVDIDSAAAESRREVLNFRTESAESAHRMNDDVIG